MFTFRGNCSRFRVLKSAVCSDSRNLFTGNSLPVEEFRQPLGGYIKKAKIAVADGPAYLQINIILR